MTKKRILIVEDEAITAMDEEQIIHDLGYEVTGIARTGEDAVKLAQEGSPDLILMDVKLASKMTGKEAARIIKEHQDIPLIFVSASKDQMILNEGYVRVPKPYTSAILSRAVEAVLQQSE